MRAVIMAAKCLNDLDQLQTSIKSIVQDALKQVDILQSNLDSAREERDSLARLNDELTAKLDAANKSLLKLNNGTTCAVNEYKRRIALVCCASCRKILPPVSGIEDCGALNDEDDSGMKDADIQKELEEISSLEIESQFEPDSPCFVQETPSPKALLKCFSTPEKSRVAKDLLRKMFGGNSSSVASDVILAEDTPVDISASVPETLCAFVPESMPMTFNQTTPIKNDPDGDRMCELYNQVKKPRVHDEVIKPRCGLNLLFSPLKPSPKKNKSPKMNKTPSKRILKKSHRINAEFTSQGVRKMSQTRLNMDCFKKIGEQENVRQGERISSPEKITSTPLHSVENHSDLDETSLTPSAIKKVAATTDYRQPAVKDVFISSYDRIPDGSQVETRKECRSKLPGQECQDCVKFYNHLGHGDQVERRQLMNKLSRHRTKNLDLPPTPADYWNPMPRSKSEENN